MSIAINKQKTIAEQIVEAISIRDSFSGYPSRSSFLSEPSDGNSYKTPTRSDGDGLGDYPEKMEYR